MQDPALHSPFLLPTFPTRESRGKEVQGRGAQRAVNFLNSCDDEFPQPGERQKISAQQDSTPKRDKEKREEGETYRSVNGPIHLTFDGRSIEGSSKDHSGSDERNGSVPTEVKRVGVYSRGQMFSFTPQNQKKREEYEQAVISPPLAAARMAAFRPGVELVKVAFAPAMPATIVGTELEESPAAKAAAAMSSGMNCTSFADRMVTKMMAPIVAPKALVRTCCQRRDEGAVGNESVRTWLR